MFNRNQFNTARLNSTFLSSAISALIRGYKILLSIPSRLVNIVNIQNRNKINCQIPSNKTICFETLNRPTIKCKVPERNTINIKGR
jgi:hypothetical protein